MSREWLLELGHSRLKLAPRRAGGRVGPVEAFDLGDFDAWLHSATGAARFWLAAVTPDDRTRRVTSRLDAAGAGWHAITTGAVDLSVAPAYPGLGVDRWLAMQPLWSDSQRAFCVVDAGTATTIDVVDGAGRHRGGWILPGIAASRAGLLAAAPGLRRSGTGDEAQPGPARDTARAIENGLLLQQVGAVQRALVEAEALCDGQPPALVLTGGAAGPLQSGLNGARIEPDLALRGLALAVERWRSR